MFEAFFFDDGFGVGAGGGEHGGEDFFALAAADFAGLDDGDELGEGGGGEGAVGDGEGGVVEGTEEVVEDPVGEFFGGDGGLGGDCGFVVGGEGLLAGEDVGVVGGAAVVVGEAGAFLVGEFGEAWCDAGEDVGGVEGEEVGVGEVAVVVRVFLGAHEGGFATVVIPAAGGLEEDFAAVEGFGLAGGFEVDGAADGGDGVEVFEFDFGAEFGLAFGAEGDVDVAAHLAFFHVGIADAAIDEDLAEGGQIGEGFFGGVDVGVGDDLHQRGAGAVEVDGGEFVVVGGFGDVFFEVDAGEFDDFAGVGDVFLDVLGVGEVIEGDAAADAEGEIKLGDLVVLRHVGVEVVFAVPLDDGWGGAAEHEAGEDGFFDGALVEDGKRAGEAEAGGAGVGVGLGAVLDGAGAEHFALGLELGVNFEADGDDVLGHGAGSGE